MSFYTSLTGLNAASTQLSVTSNNIANVGTTGFKRSRADFGDIFATSPLQKASSTVGQGVALKQVTQEFSQGNIQFSANSLDIAITGDGFFPLKSADGLQDIYTRNGTFMLNDSYNVVNAAGQALIAASVDSSGKADLENLSKLMIPRKTTGDARATSDVQLGLNLPADAKIPTLPFDRNDPTTYNKTTAVTVYDAGGNGYLATVYYRKTQVSSTEDPTNKWQTYVYIGDTKLQENLIQASDSKTGENLYVNKYGEVRKETAIPPQDIARGVTKLFNLDDLKNPILSTPAAVMGGKLSPTLVGEWKNGIEFPAKSAALVEDNPLQGAVFKPLIGATGYTLNTRLPISPVDDLDDSLTIVTGLEYDLTAAIPTDEFSITLGGVDYTGTPASLATQITDDNAYSAIFANGKLTINVSGSTKKIDPTPDLSTVNLPAVTYTAVETSSTLPNSITTQITYATDAGPTDTFKITLDGTEYSGTLPELAAKINQDGIYFVPPPSGGKLTISVASGTEKIDPVPKLIPVLANTMTEYTASEKRKILSTTFTLEAGAENKDLYLKIGKFTYTGRALDGSQSTLTDALKALADDINGDGKYQAELLPDATTPLSIRVSVTGDEGDPPEITAGYELTSSIASPFSAGTLEELAADINSRELDYAASLNQAGDMILLPKDSALPVNGKQVVPQFSMSASFNPAVPNFIQPASLDKKVVNFNAPFLSGEFSLKLDEDTTLSSPSLEGLRDLINDISQNNTQVYTAKVVPQGDGSKTLNVKINNLQSTLEFSADTSLTAVQLGVGSNPDSIVFDLNIDDSSNPITVDLSHLSNLSSTKKFTGVEIAREISNAINKGYGDERYFDLSSLKATETSTKVDLFRLKVDDGDYKMISLSENRFGIGDLSKVTLADAIKAVQAEVDQQTDFSAKVKVGYDPVRQSFTFKAEGDAKLTIKSPSLARNELFGLSNADTPIDSSTGTWGASVMPNGSYLLSESERRYGVEVKFDEANNLFTISSGTTGDTSSIEISRASAMANSLFGFQMGDTALKTDTSSTPLRGITSQPAVLKGNTIGINLDNKFRVDASNNQFVVTVDNVTGLIQMPEKPDYTMEEFRTELENRVNALADNFGRTVSGVKVEIKSDPESNKKYFSFTTGTTGDNSFLKVSANSIWGLTDLPSARGTTSKWIEPPQAKNSNGFPLYVDRDGMETSDPGTFSEDESRDLWSPIFLDKGELTFDTAGKLYSPNEAIAFKSTTIGTSGSTVQFSIDYASSTQYSSPFSVLKQDQNGRPEGDLIGVDIGDDGLVSASYSNGTQKSLAKVILVNFAAPTGLRQIGDASYYATSKSGTAKYGEAGSAGFGTVRSGARERANVDLTTELVELITAQRNFQANAKAIETNNTLTQAIINIRS
jgi:flagellar hook-basal body protein